MVKNCLKQQSQMVKQKSQDRMVLLQLQSQDEYKGTKKPDGTIITTTRGGGGVEKKLHGITITKSKTGGLEFSTTVKPGWLQK